MTAASVLVAAKTGRERRRKGVDIGRHDRECRKAAARTGRSGWSVATAERSGRLAEGRGGDRRDGGGERRAARPAEGRGGERRDGGGEQRAARRRPASSPVGEGRRRRLARTAGGDRELMCVGAWLWVSFFLTCAWLRVSYLLNLRGFFSFQRGVIMMRCSSLGASGSLDENYRVQIL